MSDLQEIKIGSTKIIALRDGELNIPKEILCNLDEDLSNKISEENSQLTRNNVNAYLIVKGARTLLVDTGCRDLFGPTCGFVHDEIKKANVKPEDITDIFFTHLHPDHIAGAIDKNGSVRNVSVIPAIGAKFENKIIRYFKNFEGIQPGIIANMKVEFPLEIPFIFD